MSVASLTACSTPGCPVEADFVPESEHATSPSATVRINEQRAFLVFMRSPNLVWKQWSGSAGECEVDSPKAKRPLRLRFTPPDWLSSKVTICAWKVVVPGL